MDKQYHKQGIGTRLFKGAPLPFLGHRINKNISVALCEDSVSSVVKETRFGNTLILQLRN